MNMLADETLMAFADDELDAEQRAQVEQAAQTDPAIRQRMAEITRQRARLEAAYAGVLEEAVPDRLTLLLQTPTAATALPAAHSAQASTVVSLAEVRAERPAHIPRLSSWAQWGGMAASVVLGVLLGARFVGHGTDPAMDLNRGQLVAGGAIDKALSTQLASDPAAGAQLAVQLSFVDKRGDYCRTFSTTAVAGLACQQTGKWIVQQMEAVDAPASGEVRTAASPLPPALLDAVDKRIAGVTLNGTAERDARARGWRR